MSDLERLERLEQSITQLLYEIDSNFSKAHRVITNDILPIVERYAVNSEQVWQHSKFWKQFFEASANVSLSGYEEQLDTGAADRGEDLRAGEALARHDDDYADSSFLSQPGMPTAKSHTPAGRDKHHNSAQSPFDLTRDDDDNDGGHHSRRQQARDDDELDSSVIHHRADHETPLNRQMQSLDISSSPPGEPPTPGVLRSVRPEQDTPSTTASDRQGVSRRVGPGGASVKRAGTGPQQQQQRSALLHRVLDSNWKVQATPMSRRAHTGGTRDSTSPTSSPPQMASLRTRGQDRGSAAAAATATTTPKASKDFDFDYEDDDSSMTPMSPPVTMAFSLPPSKLLRTPAKEAAKYMVDEILRTAGAQDVSSIRGSTNLARAGGGAVDPDQSLLGHGLTSRPIGAMPPIGERSGVLDAWAKRPAGGGAAAGKEGVRLGSGDEDQDSSDWGI